jgi:hypothetical protein
LPIISNTGYGRGIFILSRKTAKEEGNGIKVKVKEDFSATLHIRDVTSKKKDLID